MTSKATSSFDDRIGRNLVGSGIHHSRSARVGQGIRGTDRCRPDRDARAGRPRLAGHARHDAELPAQDSRRRPQDGSRRPGRGGSGSRGVRAFPERPFHRLRAGRLPPYCHDHAERFSACVADRHAYGQAGQVRPRAGRRTRRAHSADIRLPPRDKGGRNGTVGLGRRRRRRGHLRASRRERDPRTGRLAASRHSGRRNGHAAGHQAGGLGRSLRGDVRLKQDTVPARRRSPRSGRDSHRPARLDAGADQGPRRYGHHRDSPPPGTAASISGSTRRRSTSGSPPSASRGAR